jgi:hypothetical protein
VVDVERSDVSRTTEQVVLPETMRMKSSEVSSRELTKDQDVQMLHLDCMDKAA